METMALLSHEPKKDTMLSIVKKYSAAKSQPLLSVVATAGKDFKDTQLQGITYLSGLPGDRQFEARVANQRVDTVETYLYAAFRIGKKFAV